MKNRSVPGLTFGKKVALAIAGAAALTVPVFMGFLNAPAIRAQDEADWQTKAGGKMAFEVASVKLDSGAFRPPNFPLDNSDAYRPVGSRFSADFPLQTYISFAYKLSLSPSQREAMLAHLPRWVATDRYAIDARAAGTPSKDQMRLMMQSLLADRFQLAVHFETQTGSAYAMVLAKAGKTGPQLRPHSEGVALRSHVRGWSTPSQWRSISADLRRLHGDNASRQGGESGFPKYDYGLAGERAPRIGSAGTSRGG